VRLCLLAPEIQLCRRRQLEDPTALRRAQRRKNSLRITYKGDVARLYATESYSTITFTTARHGWLDSTAFRAVIGSILN